MSLTSNVAIYGVSILLFFIGQPTKSPENSHFEYFIGHIAEGDCDLSPNLDFILATRQRPGQDPAIDDVQNQPYQYIAVHRDHNKKDAKAIEEIRFEINNILLKNKFNKILVFGKFSDNPQLSGGVYYRFLELIMVWIYGNERDKKIYTIEGVYGGVK